MLSKLKFSKTFRASLLASLGLAVLFALSTPVMTSALSGGDFNPGRIIDDSVFFNSNTMSSAEIQKFLEAKVPVCDTNGEQPYAGTTRAAYGTSKGYPPPYTCLKDYRQDIGAKNPEDSLCNGITAAASVKASEIIYRVAQSCGINPKVLIVLLQKEQSLVTDDWPWSIQYRSATGYGCPDSGPNYSANCDASYYGFFNQVYLAARVYKYYAKYPDSFNHIAGRNNYILYNPNPDCGGSNVYIENQATAGLYNYTPYQPNASSLNNLYGRGDSCGAYGNRNFWRMFNDWFGTTYAPRAIKTSSSSAVYLYILGQKYQVPSMAILQDHGVSPNSIKTISQAEFDSIESPQPSSGLSSAVGHLVKSGSDSDSDGGSVYFISIGKRYKLKDYNQFVRFGFADSSIKKLPLSYIISLADGGILSDFISSTTTSNVFKVEAGKKRIIFSGDVLNTLNPSKTVTQLSDDGLQKVSPGDPIHNTGMFFQMPNGGVYFYNNVDATYHVVPNMEVFNCWGISKSTNTTAYFKVARTSFLKRSSSPISSLSCAIGNPNDNNSYVMVNGRRYTVPTESGLNITPTNDSVLGDAVLKIRNGGALSRAIGSHRTSTIWYLEDGLRKPIPNMHNLTLLGYDTSPISYVSASVEATMPVSSHPKFGTGQIVKSPASGAVFVINNRSRVAIRNITDFNDYGYDWSELRTEPLSFLDSEYPYTGEYVERYVKDTTTSYIVLSGSGKRCYKADDASLSAFNVDKAAVLSQSYTTSVLAVSGCRNLTTYVKYPDSAAIYYVDSGKKHPFGSYNSYLSHNSAGQEISLLDTATLNSLPTGSTL